jgi:hypothetical protein
VRRGSATISCSSPGWTTGAPRALARRRGEKGRPLKPPPPISTRPGTRGTQLTLLAAAPSRDYRQVRFDLRRDAAPANPWLAWALHLTRTAGEARDWQPVTRRGMQRVLVTLLALHHGPGSTAYLTSLRGLPATLERLRIDCQLTEAMAAGFDPLHLAEVFGISEHTAIRYAVNARQLTGWAYQQAPRIP